MAKIELKECINCGNEFKQFNSAEKVCSFKCAIEYAKIKSKEASIKRWVDSSKKIKTTPTAKKTKPKEYLQNEINKLARKIDSYFGYECIDCDKVLKYDTPNAVHGAHRMNVGGHENIRFNLHNIHAATLHCNKHNTEHKTGYDIKLVSRYGQEYHDYVHQLDLEYKVLKLNELEIKQALKIVRKLNREFDKHTKGNDLDGSLMRSYFNNLIGIYK